MVFFTEGILLKREPIKDFNEKLIFFTRDLGKIVIYAFGTRSINSIRGKILGVFEWMNLELEKTKERYVLKDISPLIKDDSEPHWQDKDFVLDLTKVFSELIPKIPFEAKAEDLYRLLKILTSNPVAKYPRSYRVFSFYHSILCELGIMPDWSGCEMCGEYCSANYRFEFTDGAYTTVGVDCPNAPKPSQRLRVDEIILRLEELYFLHYATIRYEPQLDFLNTTFESIKKISQSDYVFTSPKSSSHLLEIAEVKNIKSRFLPSQVNKVQTDKSKQVKGVILKINWQTVIGVLEKVLQA